MRNEQEANTPADYPPNAAFPQSVPVQQNSNATNKTNTPKGDSTHAAYSGHTTPPTTLPHLPTTNKKPPPTLRHLHPTTQQTTQPGTQLLQNRRMGTTKNSLHSSRHAAMRSMHRNIPTYGTPHQSTTRRRSRRTHKPSNPMPRMPRPRRKQQRNGTPTTRRTHKTQPHNAVDRHARINTVLVVW